MIGEKIMSQILFEAQRSSCLTSEYTDYPDGDNHDDDCHDDWDDWDDTEPR
jgi:hypothetical protein